MKATWKRWIALALAGTMCLGLVGCGDKEEKNQKDNGGNTQTLAQELGYGYLSEYSSLDTELEYVQTVSTAQGKLYIHGYYYDGAAFESGDRFYAMDLAAGETARIPLPELVNTDTTSENIQRISVCPDGSGYWLVTNTYSWSYDEFDEVAPLEEEPEEGSAVEEPVEEAPAEEAPAEEATDEGMAAEYQVNLLGSMAVAEAVPEEDSDDYQEPENKYTAKKCDMNGNVLQEIDLTEAVAEADWFYCQGLAQNGAGDLLISSDTEIFCFGADGQRKDNISVDTYYIQSMVATNDGTVLISYYNIESGGMEICRVENGGLSQPLEVTGINQNGNLTLFPGDGSSALLSDGSVLYSLDTATGQATRLLSWLDSDINGNRISGIVADGEDTILVLLENYNRTGIPTYELGTLTKTPADQIPKRTILTLGAEYLDDDVRNAVIDFNRKNDTYRITLVDYSVYNTEDDYSQGSKQLDMDVVSGNSPDIISLQSGRVQKYISKGALADLSKLMEEDGSVSMDQLLSGPLQGYMQDGKLYGMPYSFGIMTLYGSARLLGDRESWTLDEMAQIIDGLDEDVLVMNWSTQSDFLQSMVYQNMNRFVDYGSATCSFDSDAFKTLLKVSARLPQDYQDYGSGEDYVYVDEMQQVQAGETLMAQGYVSGIYEAKNMYNLYTRENGFVNIGYPTDSGNGALLSIYGGLAISEQCAHKDGAWEFVKMVLSDEFQTQQWSLPVTVSAYDTLMQEAMEQEYYLDENNEKVYIDSTGYIGDTEYPMEPMTQEQVDDLKAYINGASIMGGYDSDILEIVSDEAGAFFAGDKSADEVAKLVQNRVSIYLGETS